MVSMLVAAFIVGVVVAVPPGAVTIKGFQKALTAGFSQAAMFFLGSLTSDAFYALLVYFGAATLLGESVLFRLALWILGGAWLMWMGVDAIRIHINMGEAEGQQRFWANYGAGVFVTLLNPLTILGWVALAGNFFNTWSADWPPIKEVGLLAILTMLIGVLAWVWGMAALLSRIRHMIDTRVLRAFSIISGLFLIGYGLSAWWSAAQVLLAR